MSSKLNAVGFWAVCCLSASADVENEIPLGIEAVTGMRSGYVHRGFDLADSALEFQFATTISLSKENSLNMGLSHLSESDGDFSETAGYLEIARTFSKKWKAGLAMTYRDRNRSVLDSGLDFGLFSTYAINDDWTWRNELSYDFGVEGLYAASEISWSQPISDRAFVEISGGVSAVSDYQERDGFNDFFGRLILNYAWTDQIAFSPFLGTSIGLDGEDADNDAFYGGLWFQVIF